MTSLHSLHSFLIPLQVVQWTAVQEEYDDRVGSAIATIGSNLPDVGREVRDLAALMPDQRRGDLIGKHAQPSRFALLHHYVRYSEVFGCFSRSGSSSMWFLQRLPHCS